MDNRKNTETHRIFLEEIEKHTITILQNDTDRNILEKISVNLNGKTEAIAKLRRGQTAMMTEISKMPTAEEFQSVKTLALIHEERWKRFDQLCADILKRVNGIWEEIKSVVRKSFRNAAIAFLTAVFVFILYATWMHFFPNAPLKMPVP